MTNATISFFTYFLLVFLMSIFHVRKCNGSYLSCFYESPSRGMKFNTSIDELVQKNKPISSTQVGFKVLL